MSDSNLVSLAKQVYELCYLEGDFVLRSGRRTKRYFDKYQFESNPTLLRSLAERMVALVPPGTELLGGLEMGGIPVVTALSYATGIPAVFVRKEAKTHGTARLAEGPSVVGRRLLIVEDVVTSGGQIKLSAKDLRGLGAHIEAALCVVDREEGGSEALAEDGISLIGLLTGAEIEVAGGNVG